MSSEPDLDRAIAIVPARAGSKGIPGKNLARIGGVNLVARAVQAAADVPEIDEVFVSTDGEEIAIAAKEAGASLHWRPPELARDDSPVIDAVRHLRDELIESGRPARYGVLLEPTTPLRSSSDVAGCLSAVLQGADSAATFTEAAIHPHRTFVVEDESIRPFIDGAVAWMPRQALQPSAYQLTGGAYAFDFTKLPEEGVAFLFGKSVPIIVPRERSADVDDHIDLQVVETLLARRSARDN